MKFKMITKMLNPGQLAFPLKETSLNGNNTTKWINATKQEKYRNFTCTGSGCLFVSNMLNFANSYLVYICLIFFSFKLISLVSILYAGIVSIKMFKFLRGIAYSREILSSLSSEFTLQS